MYLPVSEISIIFVSIIRASPYSHLLDEFFGQRLAVDGVEELGVDAEGVKDVTDASTSIHAILQTDDVNVVETQFGFRRKFDVGEMTGNGDRRVM